MTNFNFQGKIIRHFWGKLIRQSTVKKWKKLKLVLVYNLLPGGGQFSKYLVNTFFHYGLKE